MASLSGQTIQSTYQGLLKLDNSTTGITQSFQNITDGLGDTTGLRIRTNQLESPNIVGIKSYKARYYGTGFQNTAPQQLAAGTQNIIIATPFYDAGLYSYSAFSYSVITATTSSDSVEIAFYNSQMLPEGLFPYQPLLSGITLTGLTTTGVKNYELPSTLSFSGDGGGVYFLVMKISNGGVTPTIRFGAGGVGFGISTSFINGVTKTPGVNLYSSNPVPISSGVNSLVFSGQTTFDNPFSTSLPSAQTQTQTINGSNLGFILHTI